MGTRVHVAYQGFVRHTADMQLLRERGVEFTIDQRPGLDEAGTVALIGDAHGVLAGSEPYTEQVFAACPHLRVLSRIGVGYDNIDVAAATRHGVAVCTAAGANAASVADMTMALLLALARHLIPLHARTAAGAWEPRQAMELDGKTLGVVGTGRIGRATVARARAFGMRVLGYDAVPDPDWADQNDVTYTTLEALLGQSDFVTLHAPLTDDTRWLIGSPQLALMRRGAYLINTARGELVDEAALAVTLRSGQIAGAALDVFAAEPPAGSPLLGLADVVLTPHVASATREADNRVVRVAVENALAVLGGGEPHHILNPAVLGR